MKKTAIAVGFGDVHLSLNKPSCRNDECWLGVQAGYLKQVKDIAKKHGNVPVLCSGDLFDKWNPSPELINFALEHLPDGMICVPGQHDLPNHNIDDMHRSGYGVLVNAGKIEDVSEMRNPKLFGGFTVYGYGWGQEIITLKGKGMFQRIALVHKYMWVDGKQFQDAPGESHVSAFKKEFSTYDFVISGDNHSSFIANIGDCILLNQGTFIRRKSDEINCKPCVAVLYDDGSYQRIFLDTSADKFHHDVKEQKEIPVDMKAFIDGLEKLGEQGLDFRQAVKEHLLREDYSDSVKQIVLKSIE